MCPEKPYDAEWFSRRVTKSINSAKVVVPLVINLVKPKSVVDVGCATGAWLSVFREYGVENIAGLDGDYVDRSILLIDKETFYPVDLSRPFSFNQVFDLAVSLEVAEHLPKSSAENFIDSLVRLAPVVLFSAAIPYQGGRNHINLQWPEYWNQIFLKYNYIMCDPLRKLIFNDERVTWPLRQNMFMFVKADLISSNTTYHQIIEENKCSDLLIIHPRVLMGAFGLRATLKRLPMLLLNRIFGIQPTDPEPWHK